MPRVFVTTYEIVGQGLDIAKEHRARVDAAKSAHWAYVESVGGKGFRPDHNGGLRSVFFDVMPKGWRKVGGNNEAVPRKDNKAACAEIAALPKAPRAEELASAVGYSPDDLALDSERGTIFFPTELVVEHPAKRHFVRLPRFTGDGFEPDAAILRALPESEFMTAIDAHNAEARRLREEA